MVVCIVTRQQQETCSTKGVAGRSTYQAGGMELQRQSWLALCCWDGHIPLEHGVESLGTSFTPMLKFGRGWNLTDEEKDSFAQQFG